MQGRVDDTEAEKMVRKILKTNELRLAEISSHFDPITGENSVGKRRKVHIDGFPVEDMWLPVEMFSYPLVKQLSRAGSIDRFMRDNMGMESYTESDVEALVEQFVRIRIKEDVAFWFAFLVRIKPKGGGSKFPFVLRRPQRRLVKWLEDRRRKGKPIRLIMLKARQWGGSTVVQMYMAWLQMVHKVGLNSLIIAQVKDTADTIRGMFKEMLKDYPVRLLHEVGDEYDENEKTFMNFGNSENVKIIPQRFSKVKIGTAERPESVNGEDYNLIHCSEVGLWKKTDGKTPEAIVQNATNGVLYRPYTMIVYESTANGTGNFFHREWIAATKGISQFEPFFVPWYEIYDLYHLDFDNDEERYEFAKNLYENRLNHNAMSDREEPGEYLWKLWEMGAPLEAIHWYIEERKKFTDHGDMASGYPSDSVEAFKHSGSRVFNEHHVEAFRAACCAPKMVGDIYGEGIKGKAALVDLRFKEDHQGLLWVWDLPEKFDDIKVTDRYLVVVDIGGRGAKADWSVICVFDRYWMIEDDKPSIVAQWYGHIDMDLLAWKAAQIAKFYDDALLVIESNTLETKDRDRILEGGDQSEFILNEIQEVYGDRLYARKQSAEDIQKGLPRKYGFHTNVKTKPEIISTLIECVREHLYVERDERCLDEFITYERKQNGAYGAIDGKHDDLLMTRAIGLHICFKEMERPRSIDLTKRNTIISNKVVSAATI